MSCVKNMRQWRLVLLILPVVMFLAPPFASGADGGQESELPYKVIEGKTGAATFDGYRRFHKVCHICHGEDGMGTPYAPALVDSLKEMDYDSFAVIVASGLSQPNRNIMPAFGENTEIFPHLSNIYAYLRARADGVLAPGRPSRLIHE